MARAEIGHLIVVALEAILTHILGRERRELA
jgi:hypothetical protein